MPKPAIKRIPADDPPAGPADRRRHEAADRLALDVFSSALARHGVDYDTTAALAVALQEFIEHGTPLEKSLGLTTAWAKDMRGRRRTDLVHHLFPAAASQRAAVRELERRLHRYRDSSAYRSDLDGRTQPTGDREKMFALLLLTGGKVPGGSLLRKLIRARRKTG